MKKACGTKPAIPGTRAEMDELAGRIAELMLTVEGLENERDRELAEVRARYAPRIEAYGGELKPLAALARRWANANAAEFGEKRTLELSRAFLSWRIGQPAVALLNGWIEPKAIAALLENLLGDYVRVAQALDREAILANRAFLDPKKLAECGITIEQKERFHIEPKRDETAPPF